MITATDISLIFLGILIVMVLLEVRKLGRKPEPVSRLEEQFERLSRQMERIGNPRDVHLPGGAQLVEAGHSFETLTEQLERLGESTADLDAALATEDGVRRFLAGLDQLREELATAEELVQTTARGLGQASESMLAAGAALQRVRSRIDEAVAPAAREAAPDPATRDDARHDDATPDAASRDAATPDTASPDAATPDATGREGSSEGDVRKGRGAPGDQEKGRR